MYFEMIGESYEKDNTTTQYLFDKYEQNLNEFVTIIDEAYYGKTAEIKKIENKIEEIREKYGQSRDQMKANTSKEKEELEDLFCDAFGFTCCSIHIEPDMTYNACTLPISTSVFDFRDFRKYIVSNGKGIKYKKEANIYLIISINKGLFFSTNFTAAEITAILLHEVGHNFQTAISSKTMYLNIPFKAINLLIGPLLMFINPQAGPFRNAYTDIIKKIEKDFKEFADCYWFIKNIIKTIEGIGLGALFTISQAINMMNPAEIIANIPQKILTKVQDPLNFLYLPGKYSGESVSDAFASSYGYGVELTSAFEKMKRYSGGLVPDQVYRSMGPIGAYYDLINLPGKIISTMFDAHPNDIARLKNQALYLEQELQKNEKNPKMKKELQKQISEINKTIDKYLSMEESGYFFTNRFDKLLLMLFGGDPRNFIANGTNEEFDQAEARAEEQLKEIKSKR